jgi:hypothetical protein
MFWNQINSFVNYFVMINVPEPNKFFSSLFCYIYCLVQIIFDKWYFELILCGIFGNTTNLSIKVTNDLLSEFINRIH